MKDLQAKLEQAQTKRNAIFGDIESLRANEAQADAEIEAIKAEISEAKKPKPKPKLRHGDYGRYHEGTEWLVLYRNHDYLEIFGSSSGSGIPATDLSHKDVSGFLGNIFDDLKAMQKNVTEFEMTDTDPSDPFRAELTDNGDIRMSVKGSTIYVYENEIPYFKTKIAQMEATLRRQEAKK